MPTFTPKALEAELADARYAGIQEAANLLAGLGAVSASVAAGALSGLAQDAHHAVETARDARDAEAAAKAEKKPAAVE